MADPGKRGLFLGGSRKIAATSQQQPQQQSQPQQAPQPANVTQQQASASPPTQHQQPAPVTHQQSPSLVDLKRASSQARGLGLGRHEEVSKYAKMLYSFTFLILLERL